MITQTATLSVDHRPEMVMLKSYAMFENVKAAQEYFRSDLA